MQSNAHAADFTQNVVLVPYFLFIGPLAMTLVFVDKNRIYRTGAIITRDLYTFYSLFEVHLCTVTFGLMYG